MLSSLILSASEIYSFVIVVYVLFSWFPRTNGLIADIYAALGKVCDPYLDLFKRLIPPIGGMVDITPIIALLVLQFGASFLAMLL